MDYHLRQKKEENDKLRRELADLHEKSHENHLELEHMKRLMQEKDREMQSIVALVTASMEAFKLKKE